MWNPRMIAASLWMVAAMVLGVGGCGPNGAGADRIGLSYTPTASDIGTSRFAGVVPSDVKLYVDPVNDARADKDTIGQDAEDRNPPIIYKSPDSPTEFVRTGVMRELSNAGINVVSDRSAATRILDLDLTRFNCEIHGLFHSEVTANAQIKDPNGRTLWEGRVRGYDEHFGRNSNLENVREGLSNAVGKVAVDLLSIDGAVKAMK